jgi:hypothetical protein
MIIGDTYQLETKKQSICFRGNAVKVSTADVLWYIFSSYISGE